MVVQEVVDNMVTKVLEYCSKDETRAQFETKILSPVLQYVADKFSWGVRIFQVVAVLVLIQTVILLWLLARDMRRAVAV